MFLNGDGMSRQKPPIDFPKTEEKFLSCENDIPEKIDCKQLPQRTSHNRTIILQLQRQTSRPQSP